jgi:hypothetical protein
VLRSIQALIVSALPPTMSVDDAASLLGISRSTASSEAARYRRTGGAAGLPSLALGSRVVVLTVPLLELLCIDGVSDARPALPNSDDST